VKPDTIKLLEKAGRAIRAAEVLLGKGDAEFAAGRAYYAMFYVAEALLNEMDLRFQKHGGVHGAFGEHFASSGMIDAKFHRWLLDAFDRRIQADYGLDAVVTTEEADRMVEQAREFLLEGRRFLDA
jgi:uncharacterized protein (UPF0332 family)